MWKIILNGTKFLHQIVRWKVSNGCSINTIEDVWIFDKSIDRWTMFVIEFNQDTEILKGFIREGKWDVSKLKQFFWQQLIEVILSVPIHSELQNDQLELQSKRSGKSISVLILEKHCGIIDEDRNWRLLKKLKLCPRVELFWWRLDNNAIPSNEFVEYRRLLDFNGFMRGCNSIENLKHIAVNYVFLSKELYLLNRWEFKIPIFINTEECYLESDTLSKSIPF
ncbi:hypothetical protein KFK09_022384 [Dendrobium nobile]|uniref:Uncharacterized protein n=1 Tax=Dendrobium nobile TaxID=94219 RepID=A0A8T3AIE8_DENNO|nr:hypothetical protein KFK09_022384 [Dendrobium nobile]